MVTVLIPECASLGAWILLAALGVYLQGKGSDAQSCGQKNGYRIDVPPNTGGITTTTIDVGEPDGAGDFCCDEAIILNCKSWDIIKTSESTYSCRLIPDCYAMVADSLYSAGHPLNECPNYA